MLCLFVLLVINTITFIWLVPILSNFLHCRYAADFLKRLGGLLGIKWEERDMQNMLEGGAIVIANHQSSLDLLGKNFYTRKVQLLFCKFIHIQHLQDIFV